MTGRDLLPPRRLDAVGETSSINERRLWIFLAIWFAAGVLQSIFTNLDGEEAYYAVCAKHLAWGYFEHPPALALFVRLGMTVLPGQLGARIMMVVLSTATLWIGSRLLDRKLIPIYILTVCALVLTQAGSFSIKTDVPLLFFAALFFYFVREYLEGRVRVAVAVLPVAIAGMLLSKYHGVLVVGLTVMSTPALLRRASFWLIVLLSAVLVLPHAVWLYTHDFVTIRYHLGGRTDAGFSWLNVFGYLIMQPFVLGPAVGVLLLPAALVAGTHDAFERVLKFNLVGILAFFLVASFGVRIHMHWTSLALIPVLVLGIPYLCDRQKLRKALVVLSVTSAAVFVAVRIYLAWDFLPGFLDRKMEIVHGWAQWADDVRRLADGRNVVFIDDYGSAGKYTFYTGQMAQSYNSLWGQQSEHDLWPLEETFRGQPAMIVNVKSPEDFKTASARNGVKIRYRFVDDYQTYSKVEVRPAGDTPLRGMAATPFEVPVTLVNHDDSAITFKAKSELPARIAYYFCKGKDIVCEGACDVIAGATLEHELGRTIELRPPATPGVYTLRLAIRPGWLPPSHNPGAWVVTVGAPTG